MNKLRVTVVYSYSEGLYNSPGMLQVTVRPGQHPGQEEHLRMQAFLFAVKQLRDLAHSLDESSGSRATGLRKDIL